MAGATVTPLPRIACTTTMVPPVITAGNLILVPQAPLQAYMPQPWASGDITWQGAEFGFAAPGGSGAQVQRIMFQLTHRISALAAFTSATAQVYAGSTPVGAPFPLNVSINYVTDTFNLYSGYPAAQLPNLAVRVTWHSVAPGLTYVHSLYAEASYSYPSAVTPFSIAARTRFPAPQPFVNLPFVNLVSLGAESNTLAPAFGQSTTAGNLLVGWVYSNSGSATFDTTCSDPSWTLAGHAGAAFGWLSLWYKLKCHAGETAPVFSTPASVPQSQVAEFTGVKAFDQFGAATGTASYAVAAGGHDMASGDLIVSARTWIGTNNGPTTLVVAAADSAGHNAGLTTATNATTTAGSQFWSFAWGQAGQAFAPGVDTVTETLGVFAGGQAVLASFISSGLTAPPGPVPGRIMGARVAVVPITIGRG